MKDVSHLHGVITAVVDKQHQRIEHRKQQIVKVLLLASKNIEVSIVQSSKRCYCVRSRV